LFYRAGRRLYGEVFALPAGFQMLSSQLVYRFFTISRTFLLPLKLFSASVLKLFHFGEDNEGWELSHRYYRYRNDSTPIYSNSFPHGNRFLYPLNVDT
jgi:hypothetical protein